MAHDNQDCKPKHDKGGVVLYVIHSIIIKQPLSPIYFLGTQKSVFRLRLNDIKILLELKSLFSLTPQFIITGTLVYFCLVLIFSIEPDIFMLDLSILGCVNRERAESVLL